MLSRLLSGVATMAAVSLLALLALTAFISLKLLGEFGITLPSADDE